MSLSLYIHIPFCEVKCGYCDFFSVPRGHGDFDLQKEYTGQLLREIGQRSPEFSKRKIHSLFFGGGTPSLLDPSLMESILRELSRHFSWSDRTEITLEANPKTVSREKLAVFRSLGFNRLSIGVQSFQDQFLKVLGRIHSGDEARRTVENAFDAGFDNVNLDLIYALPGQTLTDLLQDLETAFSLKTTHLSAYNLTIETGTPFERLSAEGRIALPQEEQQVEMLRRVRSRMKEERFVAYEISNFARPGFECRHNLNYWNYGEYLGFGAGAVSSVAFSRRQNVRDLRRYLAGESEQETEAITFATAVGEFMMMGLRKADGISRAAFQKKFCETLERIYPKELDSLLRDNWIEEKGDCLRLTEKGLPVANEILMRFLPG